MHSAQQQTAERAYRRWARNGRPPGTGMQDWEEAEAELRQLDDQAGRLAAKALPQSADLLAAVLENSAAVVSVKDFRGRYLLVNYHFETLFRVTEGQVVGRTDHDLFPAEVADALRANDLRVLASGTPLEAEEAVPHDGDIHAYLSLCFPIHGPSGVPYAVCRISADVTARKQARDRLLAEHAVTRTLAHSRSLGDAAPGILQAVCACLGWEAGIFWGVDRPANVLRCLEVWHAPGTAAPEFDRLSRQAAFPPGAGLPGRVWAGGRPGWVASVVPDGDCPRAAAARAVGLQGACGFPVRNGGEILGVIECFSRANREPDEGVLDMMASISSQVSQFAERREAEKALHERDTALRLARAIQQRRLPAAAPALAGFDIGCACRPARETGGDYLDFIPLPGGSLGIAVGDASGHGIGAALLMAETRAYLRALAGTDADPGRVLALVNRHVAEDIGDDFVTLLLALLHPGTNSLVYSNAGHWPGYVLDRRGEVTRTLPSTGLPLGLDPAAAFPSAAPLTLGPGDLVLLITDGIVEAFSPEGPLFGTERTLSCVRAHRSRSPGEIVAALFDDVRAFSRGLQTDDMTAMIIKAREA